MSDLSHYLKLRLFCAACALSVLCVAASADPFAAPAPAALAPETGVRPSAPLTGYRVAGVVVSEGRAIAVVQAPDGKFRVVSPGGRVGGATVVGITLDAVEFETGSGVSRLAVGE